MDWNKLSVAAIGVAFLLIWFRMWRSGGLRALFERSRDAPQHWGTFAFLMAMVVLFIFLLIRL